MTLSAPTNYPAPSDASVDIKSVYERAKGFNSSNLDKFRNLYARDVSVHFVPTGIAASGLENAYTLLRSSWNVADTVESEERVRLTVGDDSVVEEVVLTLVHSDRIDWLLPDCRATQKRVVVPMVISTTFTGNLISSKRFYWDQASVLKQLGVLPSSLYCKAAGYEMVLPVIGVKVADLLLADRPEAGVHSAEHLVEAARDLENLPAGVTSKQANESHGRKPKASLTPRKQTIDSIGNILSPETSRLGSNSSLAESEAGTPETFRSSTRVFSKPKSTVFDTNAEPEPFHTSIPIDPRRHQNQLNVFDDSPYTPPRPARRDPNYSGDTGVTKAPRSGKKMLQTSSNSQLDDLSRGSLEPNRSSDQIDVEKMRERPIARNNESHFDFQDEDPVEVAKESSTQRSQILENHQVLSKANESHFTLSEADVNNTDSTPKRTIVKHFPDQTAFKSSISFSADGSKAEAARPSSR